MCNIPTLSKGLHNWEKFFHMMRDAENRGQWTNQPRLKRNFELYQRNRSEFAALCKPEDSGQQIALFLLNLIIKDPQPLENWEPRNRKEWALQCLACYLEQSCYWAAKQVWEQHSDCPWEDYFSMARCFVGDTDKLLGILTKYKPEDAVITTYVQKILVRTIKTEAEVGKFSNWRLLCETSQNELREALQIEGYREPQISWYLFVRQYFKQIYKMNKVKVPTRKTGQKWPQPDEDDFSETAESCNVEKSLSCAPHEVSVGLPFLDSKQVETWLNLCIKALRDYPQSINRHSSVEALQDQFGDTIEYQLLDNYSNSPLPALEESSRKRQVNTAFLAEIEILQVKVEQGIEKNILKPYHRNIPVLYYGIGLTHTQIAKKLGINQSSISRHLWKYYEGPLVEKLASLGKSPKWFQSKILQWLNKDYSSPVYSDLIQEALVEAVKQLELETRKVLNLRYFEKLTSSQISQRLCITELEVNQRIVKAQQGLEKSLFDELTKWHKSIVTSWLEKFWKTQIELVLGDASPWIVIDVSRVGKTLRDVLLDWISATMNINLDSEAELRKVDRLIDSLWVSPDE